MKASNGEIKNWDKVRHFKKVTTLDFKRIEIQGKSKSFTIIQETRKILDMVT